MGRKNVLHSFKMIDSGDISGDLTSGTTNVAYLDYSSIVLTWNGSSPSGTLAINAKNGENEDWVALDFGSTIAISGNSGTHTVVLTKMPFTDLQIDYTSASGTGTLDAVITAKQGGS